MTSHMASTNERSTASPTSHRLAFLACIAIPSTAQAQQPAFAVATIRPSSGAVSSSTTAKPNLARLTPHARRHRHTCIKWAYGVQDNQIAGPAWLDSERYDIIAKADTPATEAQMKLMLQTLLADRFQLTFHHQNKELKAFALTIAKGGPKLSPAAAPDAKPFRQNSANGTVVKSMSIRDFADFISGPLQTPVSTKPASPAIRLRSRLHALSARREKHGPRPP